MINSKTTIFQAVVIVTIILCMQTAIGLGPANCICYSNGGNTPRTPCNTDGCSAAANQTCQSDVSLFLYYPVNNITNPASPSSTYRRFGACSCPLSHFHRYASSNNNAYFSSGTSNYYYNINSCNDFGNIPVNNTYPGASSNYTAYAIDCCNACCGSNGD